ncbi:uncharacterized protein OCT59_020851 [Rhizophagus irregularis]|uniref:uncharacterized protein n=1 Tax=Rhizophagus irregularis TaxID=588596 RepID=UPI00331B1E08|nr:hypothetical protein OCT59_020851 [Rhizophagus irregularis]
MKTWKYLLIFLGWADKLILNATKINEYEEEHNERMRKIFSEKLGTILVEYKKNRQKCKSNGVLTTSLGTLIAYLEILEGKNEIETDKNDPIIQEALYYRDYWSQDNKQITQLFYSLYQALRLLNNFYQNLGVERSVDHQFFPYVCQFQSDGNNIISFTDIYELSDDPTRIIWKGTDENANRFDDAEARGFRMIIMEYLDGTALDQRFNKGDTIDVSHSLTIYRDVKFAINELHNKNFVFANLRPPNILIFGTGKNCILTSLTLIGVEDTMWTVIHHQ